MNLLDHVHRIEQVGLARARRAAPHVHPGDRARLGEDDGTARGPLGERMVSDLDAGDGGESLGRGGLPEGSGPGQHGGHGQNGGVR